MKAEDKAPYHQVLSEQLTRLLGHLLIKQEAERQHLATTLYDTIIQSLLALQVRLSVLEDELLVEPDEKVQTALANSLPLITDLVERLREMARELRPIELGTVGLDAALQQASEEFSSSTQIAVVYEGEEELTISEIKAAVLYRLAEEVFDNIRKHAQATKVRVTLGSDVRSVWLEIEDNGKGFLNGGQIIDAVEAPGLGLFGFMMYFQQLNGRITIQSQLKQGTNVTAVLPR
jgi:two-component system NarL family sensor kinase